MARPSGFQHFFGIGNEYFQIVSFVLTCEESTQKLLAMCHGVMERFRLANQPVPKILYIDRGCCRAQGPTAVETMFQEWFDGGVDNMIFSLPGKKLKITRLMESLKRFKCVV